MAPSTGVPRHSSSLMKTYFILLCTVLFTIKVLINWLDKERTKLLDE